MELKGKIALVTGSAKRVGKGIALGLAAEGCDVVVHYYNSRQEAEQTAGEIRALGRRCEIFSADFANPPEIAKLFAFVAEAFGRLDVLVNSASNYRPTPLESLTAEQWDYDLAVDARAPALCMKHALPLMKDGGAVVNMVDIMAERGRGDFITYIAAKGALLALTYSAAKALAKHGIRVNAVSPGIALWPEGLPDLEKEKILKKVPLGRAGSPELMAQAVVFLCRHDYITGVDLPVDGGWSLAGR